MPRGLRGRLGGAGQLGLEEVPCEVEVMAPALWELRCDRVGLGTGVYRVLVRHRSPFFLLGFFTNSEMQRE